MSDFLQLARRLAPTLLAVGDGPYWVSLCHPPAGPDVPRPEPVVEIRVGPGFDCWHPSEDCMAIFAVAPATALAGRPPSGRSRKQSGRMRGLLVCGVSRQGEAYCAMAPAGRPYVEGLPRGGRLLDDLRAKFGLPPGPPSPYDLDVSLRPG
jgi:hypothetical protein